MPQNIIQLCPDFASTSGFTAATALLTHCCQINEAVHCLCNVRYIKLSHSIQPHVDWVKYCSEIWAASQAATNVYHSCFSHNQGSHKSVPMHSCNIHLPSCFDYCHSYILSPHVQHPWGCYDLPGLIFHFSFSFHDICYAFQCPPTSTWLMSYCLGPVQ